MIGNEVLRGAALMMLDLGAIRFRHWLATEHATYLRGYGLGEGRVRTAWFWVLGVVAMALGGFFLTDSGSGR